MPRIASVEAFPLVIPRDTTAATGTAGSPTLLGAGESSYRWSAVYPCLYSVHFETTVIRVTLDNGMSGWGEAQAPLAPQVAALIATHLLHPAIAGEDFDGSPPRVRELWWRMYSAMRVRGQTGGFMLDAISGVDLALWDLAGKLADLPVAALLAETDDVQHTVPAYISGLGGATPAVRAETARRYRDAGFSRFKLFFDSADPAPFLTLLDILAATLKDSARLAVDALWRFTPQQAEAFGKELDARQALWLEAPLAPESPAAHAELAKAVETPIAIGESYRTLFEMEPFFAARAVEVLQPDLGRSGITESLRLAERAAQQGIPVVPHVSIAFGPQVAAALQFAAAVPNCNLVEYNPTALAITNRFLRDPLLAEEGAWQIPQTPGLGIDLKEEQLALYRAHFGTA